MNDIVLENGGARAEIAPRGAELRSWRVGATPLLWSPDPAIWNETAPILFPVVGWTRGAGIDVDGRRYALGLHGFARSCLFRVVEQRPSHARLVLESNAATRALYPFDWTLEVEYVLTPAAIQTRLTITNTGSRVMPYACGLHPGFCWPFADGEMEDYNLVFGAREQTSVPIISADGLFTHQNRRIPIDGRELALSPALLDTEALCFLDARSKTVRFEARSGASIDVDIEGFRHIAIWSRPTGHFLSIEVWTGHGDHVDADGDLFRKPSMIHLAPGASAGHATTFSFQATPWAGRAAVPEA